MSDIQESRTTIILVAYNEAEYVKLSIQSLRFFNDLDNLSVVLVNNGSTDGLHDWASQQSDITYIYMDEGRTSYGKVVNDVLAHLGINGDVVLMSGRFMLTRGCLSDMKEALYTSRSIGAVGPVSNSFTRYQGIGGIENYEEALKGINVPENRSLRRVMELDAGFVMLREEAMRQLGRFDEQLSDDTYVMRDYCFRLLMSDWTLEVCQSSLVWDVINNGFYRTYNDVDEAKLEEKWGMHYFNTVHNENLIKLIEESSETRFNVLEIGCDCGATLLEIKNRFPNAEVFGSELNIKAAEVASHFANVVVNNIEECNLPFSDKFDYIVFGDVLEHLRNPMETIRYCREKLKQGGCIIASIPNLMHISVVEELLRGNFTYTEVGLLDKTHIHFFTFNEIIRLFQAADYEVETVDYTSHPIAPCQRELIDALLHLRDETPRFMYEAFQYLIRARRK